MEQRSTGWHEPGPGREQLRGKLEWREMELKTDAESIQTSSIRMEISLWQEKTRWIEHLSGRNLIMMVRLIELREGSGVDDDLVHSTNLTYMQSKSIGNISLPLFRSDILSIDQATYWGIEYRAIINYLISALH